MSVTASSWYWVLVDDRRGRHLGRSATPKARAWGSSTIEAGPFASKRAALAALRGSAR